MENTTCNLGSHKQHLKDPDKQFFFPRLTVLTFEEMGRPGESEFRRAVLSHLCPHNYTLQNYQLLQNGFWCSHLQRMVHLLLQKFNPHCPVTAKSQRRIFRCLFLFYNSLERSLCRNTGSCVQAIRPQMISRIKAPSLMGEWDKKDSKNKRERDLPIKKRQTPK